MSEDWDTIEMGEPGGVMLKGRILLDPEPSNPRKEFDHIATIHAAHRRYNLGDVEVNDIDDSFYKLSQEDGVKITCEYCGRDLSYDGNGGWDDDREEDYDECDSDDSPEHDFYGRKIRYHKPKATGVTIFPVFMYEHSGITISMGAFSCPWDSGQLGIIYITDKQAKEAWGEEVTAEQIKECCEAEIKEYDAYLTGMVFGYIIENEDEDEIESCWGFYDEADAKSEATSVMLAITKRVQEGG